MRTNVFICSKRSTCSQQAYVADARPFSLDVAVVDLTVGGE